MSIKIMSRVWDDSEARLGSRLVLLALADFSNDSGISWPSVDTLAKKSRLSERQVQRIIRELVDLGEIHVDEGAGPKGCNLYRVILRDDNSSPRQNSGGDIFDGQGVTNHTKGVTNRTGNVSKMSPEPSIEPSIEPSSNSLPAKPKKQLPANGLAQQIVAAYCQATGIDKPASYPKAVGIAQRIADAGVIPEEIPDFVAWMRRDEWLSSRIDLGMMLSQVDKWRISANTRAKSPTKIPGLI